MEATDPVLTVQLLEINDHLKQALGAQCTIITYRQAAFHCPVSLIQEIIVLVTEYHFNCKLKKRGGGLLYLLAFLIPLGKYVKKTNGTKQETITTNRPRSV